MIEAQNYGWYKYFPKPTPRPQQVQAINEILNFFENESGEIFLLDAPTGIGKSIIGLTLARFYASRKLNTSYLVNNKFLEDQILKDAPYVMKTLGRNNFYCIELPDNTADYGRCRIEKNYRCGYAVGTDGIEPAFISAMRGPMYWKSPQHCDYWEMKARAINHPIVVHNYPYFMFENNYSHDFGPRHLLICDEGHNIEKVILNFMSFSISTYHNRFGIPIGDRIPKGSTQQWIPVLYKILNHLDKDIPMIARKLDRSHSRVVVYNEKSFRDKDLIDMENFRERLMEFYAEVSQHPEEWVTVYEYGKKGQRVTFKPIFISKYTKHLMFDYGVKVLIMSATLLSQKMIQRTLGLGNRKTKYLCLESPFPIETRYTHYLPILKINKDTINLAINRLTPAIQQILHTYQNDKGIIHTRSYKLAEGLYNNISSPRMLIHSSQDREETIERFMQSNRPYVLISPSIEEGVDLKDDLCRFIIIAKIPYSNLGDEQIKQRMKRDPEWYTWTTVQSLIQMAGRGTRHENDWSASYILDGNFSRLLSQGKEFFPKWFTDSLVMPK